MSYRLRYEVSVDWVGDGQGPMGGAITQLSGAEAGGAQTLKFFNAAGGQNIVGTGTGGAIAAANITTLLAAMSADLSTQMNVAAKLAQLQGFATGGG